MFPVTDHVLIFTVITLVILLAPLLASRVRMPDLVLLLLAGTALGEHGFGVLERNEAITLFGEVGLLYIMFLAGLEIDLYEFSRTRKRSLGFGMITFLLPQVLGAAGVYYLLGDLSVASAVLMASMFASHTLLAYPVAARLGIHRSEPVTIAVGATIITDILALLVLAVVVDASQDIALNAAFWAGLLSAMVVLVLLITLLIPRFARWFFKHVGESGGTQFLFVLTVVCACAYLSQFARMKPIIGAFLAVAAFNRQIPEHSALHNRLEFVGNTLFIPFFLISVGMLVDPRVLMGDPRTWKVIGVMVGLVVLTKWLSAMIGGWLFGYNRSERNVVFGLSVVQAAATLAAVLVGFDAGLLDERALNGAIAMIVVTVPLGSWAVQRWGREMALAGVETPKSRGSGQRLLIPVRRSASAAALMELGMLIRDPARPGGLFPLTVVSGAATDDDLVGEGERLLAGCINRASAADMEVEPQLRMDLNPADGIVRAARELRADTVVTGWGDAPSRGARIFGSVQHALAEQCPSRLIVCRLSRPLQTCRNLRVGMPPLSEHRGDLDVLVRETKLLAKQAGLDLHVYLSGPAAEGVRKRFERTQPGCEMDFTVCGTWKESRERMFMELGREDVVILPQVRRDTVLWAPTLDRLPEMAVRACPEANLLAVYPALEESDPSATAPVEAEQGSAFPEVRAVDLPAGGGGEPAVEALVRGGLPDDTGMAEEALPLLKESARITPVDLSKEAVLLHAHCGARERPLLLVGYGEGGGSFFERDKAPKIILALLSPRGDSPEHHLRSLSQVAKAFRRPETAEAVDRAGNAGEVCAALRA